MERQVLNMILVSAYNISLQQYSKSPMALSCLAKQVYIMVLASSHNPDDISLPCIVCPQKMSCGQPTQKTCDIMLLLLAYHCYDFWRITAMNCVQQTDVHISWCCCSALQVVKYVLTTTNILSHNVDTELCESKL